MTWAINLSLPYIDTEHGQNVLENMRKTLLDVFAAAEIGASAIVDDTILTNLNLNIITVNNVLEPYGMRLYGVEKYGQLEFKLDFIDPLTNRYTPTKAIKKAGVYARHALIKAGFTLTPWHFN
ncbi:MAG: hypothetical protein CMH30_01165 [Micavibrio sp.]|nr:hypothetical protein [Micavibrio sp.]|tara:strand:- start:1269 stop:1637 length:369 start_codon:yes stop_codon:yes gene_type:complete